ncbi:MAG: hypothetical protein GY953_21230, partial [bacterium]|nr:hypothetical protein [bacterium]
MVDFRKSILLLAILLAVGSVASAQIVNPAFQCTANAGVPPIVRAEGIAELVGDVVLNCTGGTPTALAVPVPQVNFRIFLNVNVTSWLLDGNRNEALLIIDDPDPDEQRACSFPFNPTCALVGVGGEPGINYAVPGAAGNNLNDVYNVYQGTWISPNQVEWLAVPIDPPGTQSTRIIRITNVRANANQLGVSGTLVPSQISMFISATGATSVPINNPTQLVAFVQDGLSFSTTSGSFLQCEDADEYDPCDADFFLEYRENFATAFKVRGTQDQAQPLIVFNTESGHTNDTYLSNNANVDDAGYASQGTRLLARFHNVPPGVTLRVYPMSTDADCDDPDDGESTNTAWLVDGADDNGAGDSPDFDSDWYEVSLDSAGWGSATWEITADDPFQNDVVYFAVDVVYDANTTAGIPALGTATVNGSYAPLSTVVLADDDAPRPRFFDDSTAEDLFTINSCATNLLWPFVTSLAGFDTGMAISNTSLDPFGTATQEGACTLYYFGISACAPVPTPLIPAGEHHVWTLLGGPGACPGFQGYVIASCEFQMAHGYAFISDIGATKLAQGYLALVMDEQ